MRIVIDTGILIAALITKDTPPDLIYQAWRKNKFELITSEWQLSEFPRVSRYPKLRKYLVPSEAGNMINGLRYQALVLTDLPTLEISPDPDDNPVLAMAVAGEADFLVSGDKRDLLALKIIEKTKIVTARNFLTQL
ncbi:MAG: putative toxin-antitoxin system toxin component, PIN family [Gammaproteobacteria bacterium]|nr:MAG: putative toxin-antitoxin system toxin component, PIN family [Gammaproteobacteria bacterium]